MRTNPSNFVEPGEEDEWEEAKQIVREQYPEVAEGSDRFYALATSIFKDLAGKGDKRENPRPMPDFGFPERLVDFVVNHPAIPDDHKEVAIVDVWSKDEFQDIAADIREYTDTDELQPLHVEIKSTRGYDNHSSIGITRSGDAQIFLHILPELFGETFRCGICDAGERSDCDCKPGIKQNLRGYNREYNENVLAHEFIHYVSWQLDPRLMERHIEGGGYAKLDEKLAALSIMMDIAGRGQANIHHLDDAEVPAITADVTRSLTRKMKGLLQRYPGQRPGELMQRALKYDRDVETLQRELLLVTMARKKYDQKIAKYQYLIGRKPFSRLPEEVQQEVRDRRPYKGTSISYRLTREKLEEAKRIRRELERFDRNYDRIVQRAVRNAWVELKRG